MLCWLAAADASDGGISAGTSLGNSKVVPCVDFVWEKEGILRESALAMIELFLKRCLKDCA
jgi:hypothetical protein